jgi:hypothetical protein
MKISALEAMILGRILERYYMFAEQCLEYGFNNHQERLNKELFVETAEDLAIITKLYPELVQGQSIRDAVNARLSYCRVPDPFVKQEMPQTIESVGPSESDIMKLIGGASE